MINNINNKDNKDNNENSKRIIELDRAIKTRNKAVKEKKYEEYVKEVTPVKSLPVNMCKAFLVGGTICLLGQIIINIFKNAGFGRDDAASWETLILVFAAVILTGMGFYSKLGEFAGAGSLVPITGFANSIASSAIEFKKEGQVFGIGCKIFTIAGPVILYGIFSSWILGLIYWVLKLFNM